MRKLFFIFLSSLVLLNSSGYIILFTHLKSEFRQEIEDESFYSAHKNELVAFRINKSDVESGDDEILWLEESEFEINGSMYDVVKREETRDQYIIYCINDKREERMLGIIDVQLDYSSPLKNTIPLPKILLKKPVLTAAIENPFYVEIFFKTSEFSSLENNNYNSFNPEINTPPPRIS